MSAPATGLSAMKCQIEGCEEYAEHRPCFVCGKKVCWEHRYNVTEGGLPATICVDCLDKR